MEIICFHFFSPLLLKLLYKGVNSSAPNLYSQRQNLCWDFIFIHVAGFHVTVATATVTWTHGIYSQAGSLAALQDKRLLKEGFCRAIYLLFMVYSNVTWSTMQNFHWLQYNHPHLKLGTCIIPGFDTELVQFLHLLYPATLNCFKCCHMLIPSICSLALPVESLMASLGRDSFVCELVVAKHFKNLDVSQLCK